MTKLQAGILSASAIAVSLAPNALASGHAVAIDEVRLVGVRADVEIDGAGALLETLATRAGAPLSERAVAADIARLWRSGRFSDVRVERSPDASLVVFRVEPHPLSSVLIGETDGGLIEAIEIRGNKRTREAVIRRELVVAPGDPVERETLVRSANNLRRLGYFEKLAITMRPGSTPRLAIVTFELEERDTGSFEIGVSIGEISGVGATASVGQSNLFGTGHELDLAARLAAREQQFQLRYTNPRIADSWWRGTARVYDTRRELAGYRREATGGALTLGRRLSATTSAALTYRLENVSVNRDELATALLGGSDGYMTDLFRGGVTSSVRADLAYDSAGVGAVGPMRTRGRLRSGLSAGGYSEIASSWLGSQNEFQRSGAWIRLPVAFGGGFGLVASSRVDFVTSSDPRGVPLSERLHAGGLHSVRGYGVGELSPELTVGGPDELSAISYGGNLRLLASVELHVPLIEALGISGVLFADAGNVFNLERRTCRATGGCASALEILAGLRASVGFGLRWASPIGNLRFEWGLPLVRRPGEPRIRFHFGVGPQLL